MATKTRQLADFLQEGGVQDIAVQQNPHIQPGTLYPSYVASGTSNKLLDGTTAHNGAFGTVQTDGRKYYYTNINGSKPIKDPRIGSHFGSQRHKFKSLQKLEEETATHGANVYSVDGREWVRACGDKWVLMNNTHGCFLENSTSSMADDNHFIEIVGYFNDANLLHWPSGTANDRFGITLNGGTRQANDLAIGAAPPLSGRCVDSSSVVNCTFHSGSTPTLGINTLRISNTNGAYLSTFGLELIAQDVSSTANRSKVQIPSQEVVSFGKKFTVSGTPHYDPFNGFTSGNLAAVQALVDTATSLGVEGWKNSSTYYRPYNGGRVVRWVASDGTIKTSVNMMPPNARSIANSASLTNGVAKANASIANNTFYPTFEATAIDSSQAEIAKTFHMREFGNGGANLGTGGAKPDASMVANTPRDVAYVMDDGLTTHSAGGFSSHTGHIDFYLNNSGQNMYIIFIGTGISLERDELSAEVGVNAGIYAQNLPYGTHIFKYKRGSSASNNFAQIDGVTLSEALTGGGFFGGKYVTFHQPKMPPIPENAVIISDYMLMADFVKQTDAEDSEISKGVRYSSGSRDHFYAGTSAAQAIVHHAARSGVTGGHTPGGGVHGVWKLPFFGTTGLSLGENSAAAHTIKLGGSSTTKTALDCSNGTTPVRNDVMSISNVVALGQTSIETTLLTGGHAFYGHYVASPIHTSSHYQTFETPYLNELVGGDRNMEQTNLVVTPDGKTWDEVIRKTDYLSNISLVVKDGADNWSSNQFWTTQRGKSHNLNMISKEWITGYDRWICLVGGYYQMGGELLHRRQTSAHHQLWLNGVSISKLHIISNDSGGNDHSSNSFNTIFEAKRGDDLYITGERHGASWSTINIKRL